MARRRTDKVFEDYNDYHDRPFGLKWGTAFALSELTKVINENKEEARKHIEALPEMSREEIDIMLQYAFLKSKKVSIQTYDRDHNGNLMDNIVGKFEGQYDTDHLYIDHEPIAWEDIRNIQVFETSSK